VGGLLASLDLHRLDYNAEPSRVARGGGPSSMGGVSFCSRSPPSGIAAPSRVTKGGGTAGEGGGASGDDDVAIGRRHVLFASALDFRPFLRLSPLARASDFQRTRPLAVGRLLGFVGAISFHGYFFFALLLFKETTSQHAGCRIAPRRARLRHQRGMAYVWVDARRGRRRSHRSDTHCLSLTTQDKTLVLCERVSL